MSKKKEEVLVLVNVANKKNLDKEYKIRRLQNYCKNKNYKIISIEKLLNFSTFDMIERIVNIIIIKNENLSKIVVLSTNELSKNIEGLFSIYTMLKEFNIVIESVSDGIIGKDDVFELTYNGLPF